MKNFVHVKEDIPKILFKKMEENNTPNLKEFGKVALI